MISGLQGSAGADRQVRMDERHERDLEADEGLGGAMGEAMSDGGTDAVALITVLLADDHALVREGTRRLLEAEPDIRVVAEAGDGAEAVARAEQTRPAVIVMDIAMPGMSGIEATRQIKARQPQVAVLALTAYDDEQYVLALLDAGAAGFLLKDVRGEELVAAVRAVARGESVLQPSVAQRALMRAISRRTPSPSPAPLSEREMEVLREAARGLPNKDIARRLNLSVRTIHTHLGNAFTKLGVGSRTEAVLLALRRGWISLDETEHPDERPAPASATAAAVPSATTESGGSAPATGVSLPADRPGESA